MTQTDPQTPSPSPSPSADAGRPAEAFPPFTERPPEPEVWRRAQHDYLGGDTARVVCERYGLSQATFFRRAKEEGWRRTDVDASMVEGPPPWAIPNWSRSVDVIAEHPEYAEIQAGMDNELHTLLFNPVPDDLRTFDFRRACEAAALRQPAQSAAWLRVQRLSDQCGDLPDPSSGPYRPEDHLRASFLRANRDAPVEEDFRADGESK